MADGSPTLLWSQKKRVDPIMQSEAAECALACLAMLAQFYGNECGLPALRRRYSSTLKGMSLNQVIEVADDMVIPPFSAVARSGAKEGLINSPQMRDTIALCRGFIHAADVR
ncbi:hypothetical protein TP49_22640 (plasmid) [Xanthomonas citri pv. aurantifolii]|nr:hypothetical protein TP50_22080 [Xanthomonas citri pv. aurantifolii]TBW93116.1 hypothetical protein TP49_22640 [Xanthomonas citri pv. aurantifolii]